MNRSVSVYGRPYYAQIENIPIRGGTRHGMNKGNHMSTSTGFNRRSFLQSAGLTALAGASGGVALTGSASAQAAGSTHIPMKGGRYDFDTGYDRRNTNTARWDGPSRDYPEGVFRYGMGVATMDFECAPCITEALTARVQHHTWGYMASTDGLRDGIIKWNGERHGLDLDPRELVISDGVYPGMIAALRTLVPRNNKALIMSPAYSGFYSMVKAARIDSVDSPMTLKNGRFEIDWADLERKMTPDVRVLILCNPQNPTGNVWREDELLRLGRLALEHKIVVLSDEIHGDFVRKGHRYVPFATLKDQAVVENSITCNAISKTFNLAGMKNAYFYSKSPVLLERVKQYHRAELSTLGVVANEAAYAEGQDWFNQARDYIDGTHDLVEKTVKYKMPQVGYVRNEGTFMTFLNFGKVIDAIDPGELAQYGGKTREENFQDWLTYKAGVYVNAGSVYGEGSDGYMRMNVASARSVVSGALDAMADAIKGL